MNISRNDSRTYQPLTLANGLRVLLIHDQDTSKSAASLAVNTGHFDDPEDRQGMAHFIEHMLFLGTDLYPESGGFAQFVSQGGGNSNAWTGTEHSSYFFDINNALFEEALTQFSRFFIAPLFSPQDAEKERNAIDAEFKLKIKDDGRRIYQVHKETVNPAHPFAKFSVGNQDTLADRACCIADELKAFFNAHYQAQWMTLAICSPLPLDEQQALVTRLFAEVKGGGRPKPAIESPLYRPCDLGKVLHIEPNKHLQKLIISFAMPNIDPMYEHKTVSFVAHLLGYEGQGSLHSILKQQGWINALSAGGGINGSNFKDFNISIALTDEGIEYYHDIVEMLFEYIALMKQSVELLPRLYDDKKTLLQIAFDNQELSRVIDWVNSLSINMHHYKPEHYVEGNYLMTGFNASCYREVMSWLSPFNMRLVLIHPGVETEHRTRWYNTPYSEEQLSPSWLKALACIDTPLEEMSLPRENPYLTRPVELYRLEEPRETPELLSVEPGFHFWFKQDATFRVAKGHFYLAMDSLYAVKDVQHMALTRLYADLFMDAVAEDFYPAELAGLSYHLSSHQGGLTLHTAGLSSSQLDLVEGLLNALFNQDICAKRFAEYKKQLVRHWRNSNENKPVGELFSRLGARLMPWNPTPDELADALSDTCYNEFKRFRKDFFKALHVEAFLHGNWRKADAKEFHNHVSGHLASVTTIADLERPLNTLREPEQTKTTLPCHDHAMVVYYQAQTDTSREKVTLMLLNQLINQDYFTSLRTEKQLGYLVGAGYAPFNNRAGLAFYVQSPGHDATQILAIHKAFLTDYLGKLDELSNEEWEQSKEALYHQIAEQDKNLRLRSQRFWLAICNGDHLFEMPERLLESLADLTLEELREYAQRTFSEKSPRMELLAGPQAKQAQKTQRSA